MINTPSQRDKAKTVIIFVEVLMPHHCVMDGWMMLGKIICCVGFSCAPVNEEVSFQCSILDSIESLVHCFGFSDSGFGNTEAVELSVSIGVGGC